MINNYIITWKDNQGKFRVNEIKSNNEIEVIQLLELTQFDFESVITYIKFNY